VLHIGSVCGVRVCVDAASLGKQVGFERSWSSVSVLKAGHGHVIVMVIWCTFFPPATCADGLKGHPDRHICHALVSEDIKRMIWFVSAKFQYPASCFEAFFGIRPKPFFFVFQNLFLKFIET